MKRALSASASELARHLTHLRVASGTVLLGLGIAACSCSGSSPTLSAVAPPPLVTMAPQPGLATADVTFIVPSTASLQLLQSNRRRPLYVSPGTTNFTVVEDGAVVVPQASAFANATYAASNGSTFTITSTAQSSGRQVDVHFTTLPGTHTIGIVTSDDAHKPNVLSEGQETWPLSIGNPPSNNRTLVLAGVAATGYIDCPTLAEIADTSGTCSNYANFSDGKFSLVALAGDADGYPIYFQPGVNFDNGQVHVVETTAGGNILTIAGGGSWSSPGTALTVNGFSAGNAFTVTCVKHGTATVALAGTSGQGTVTGIDYGTFTLPAASSTLPHGPPSIAGVAVPANAQITCSSDLGLTIEGRKR